MVTAWRPLFLTLATAVSIDLSVGRGGSLLQREGVEKHVPVPTIAVADIHQISVHAHKKDARADSFDDSQNHVSKIVDLHEPGKDDAHSIVGSVESDQDGAHSPIDSLESDQDGAHSSVGSLENAQDGAHSPIGSLENGQYVTPGMADSLESDQDAASGLADSLANEIREEATPITHLARSNADLDEQEPDKSDNLQEALAVDQEPETASVEADTISRPNLDGDSSEIADI